MCRLSWNLGAWTYWNPQGLYRDCNGIALPFTCMCVTGYWTVAGILWPISLGSLRSNWLPSFATDDDMKQGVTFSLQNLFYAVMKALVCHAGTITVITIVTIMECGVYHLLPKCIVCIEVRIKLWISVCLSTWLSCIQNMVTFKWRPTLERLKLLQIPFASDTGDCIMLWKWM
jgi:hypothetical protein